MADKEVDISFTKDELYVLGMCLYVAKNAILGEDVKEKWFNTVESFERKFLDAQIQFKEDD